MSEIPLKTIIFSVSLFFFLVLNVLERQLFKRTQEPGVIRTQNLINILHICFTGDNRREFHLDTLKPIRKSRAGVSGETRDKNSLSAQSTKEKKSKLYAGVERFAGEC